MRKVSHHCYLMRFSICAQRNVTGAHVIIVWILIPTDTIADCALGAFQAEESDIPASCFRGKRLRHLHTSHATTLHCHQS